MSFLAVNSDATLQQLYKYLMKNILCRGTVLQERAGVREQTCAVQLVEIPYLLVTELSSAHVANATRVYSLDTAGEQICLPIEGLFVVSCFRGC